MVSGDSHHALVNDQQVGVAIRAVRRRRGWRQSDLAARAGAHQSWVSLAERGHLDELRLSVVRSIGAALDIRLPISPSWRGGDLARLVDSGHAALVEHAVRALQDSNGWERIIEYTFNHFGERGSVDVVGWHPASATLVLEEVKARLVDLQDLLATADRKRRLVPELLARERGWRARSVGQIIVLEDTTTNRRIVASHAAIMETAYPGRTRRRRIGSESLDE